MRSTMGEVWVDTSGNIAEVGVVAASRGKKPLTRIETVRKGSRLRKGGAFLLLTYGKGKTAEEIEIDAPLAGKIVDIEPGVARAVTGVAAVVAAPDTTWVVRIELPQSAVEEDDDEEDDDEAFLDDELLDED